MATADKTNWQVPTVTSRSLNPDDAPWLLSLTVKQQETDLRPVRELKAIGKRVFLLVECTQRSGCLGKTDGARCLAVYRAGEMGKGAV